jgi:hypothetical protein
MGHNIVNVSDSTCRYWTKVTVASRLNFFRAEQLTVDGGTVAFRQTKRLM